MSRSRIQDEFEELQQMLESGPAEPSLKESSTESEAWYLEQRAFSQLQTIHDSKMQENQTEITALKSEIELKLEKLKSLEATLNEQLKEMEKNASPNLNEGNFDEYIDEVEDDILEREEEIEREEKTRAENQKIINKLKAEIGAVKSKNEEELSFIKNEKLRKLKQNKDHAMARRNKLESKIGLLEKDIQSSRNNTELLNEQIASFKKRMEKSNNVVSTARKAKLNTLIHLVNSHILRYNPEFMDIERGALYEVTALNDVLSENSSRNSKLIEAEVEESTQQMKDSLGNLTQLIDKSSCPRFIQRKIRNTLYKSRCVVESSKTTIPILEGFVESLQDFSLQRKKSLSSSNTTTALSSANTTSKLQNHDKSFSSLLQKEADEGKRVLKLQDTILSTIAEIKSLKTVQNENSNNVNILKNKIKELKIFLDAKSAKDLNMIEKWQEYLTTVVTKDAIRQAKKLKSIMDLNEESKKRIRDLNKKKERGLKELAKRDEHGLIKIHLCH